VPWQGASGSPEDRHKVHGTIFSSGSLLSLLSDRPWLGRSFAPVHESWNARGREAGNRFGSTRNKHLPIGVLMAGNSRTTFTKRSKERARQEKRVEKSQKMEQRKQEKPTEPVEP